MRIPASSKTKTARARPSGRPGIRKAPCQEQARHFCPDQHGEQENEDAKARAFLPAQVFTQRGGEVKPRADR
jgi:hypothetical protein